MKNRKQYSAKCCACGRNKPPLFVEKLYKATTLSGVVYAEEEHREQVALTHHGKLNWIEVKEGEAVINSSPCFDCVEKIKLAEIQMQAGGVYFRCVECGNSGVIQAGDYASKIRASAKRKAPSQCGVNYEKCEQHKNITFS